MTKSNVLIQLDPDIHASAFDALVAVDSTELQLLQYHDVAPQQVEKLVHGAMFTRGPKDLRHTAVFIGGTNVRQGEAVLEATLRWMRMVQIRQQQLLSWLRQSTLNFRNAEFWFWLERAL